MKSTVMPDRAAWASRILRRILSPAVHRWYARRVLAKADTVRMCGLALTVQPTVFHPRLFFSSRILAGYILGIDMENKNVLDMGTGSGLIALCAARKGATVTASDINPGAVACAAGNAAANGMQERVRTVAGDLFEAIPPAERFDYIFWNPPFYARKAANPAGFAWNAGEGYEVLSRFAREAAGYLHPGGTIIIILSTDVRIETVLRFFTESGLMPLLAVRKVGLFETFGIYRITPRP